MRKVFTGKPAMMGSGVLVILVLVYLAACNKKAETEVVRPVRNMVVERHEIGEPIVLTGQLHARDEINEAFRLSGKLIERPVAVGDTVKAGQVVARLDAEVEKNTRNATLADFVAAEAVLEQSKANEKRLRDLLKEKAVPRAEYEGALRQFKTANAQLNAANAKLSSAEAQLGYTELKAEADGVITAKGAEPGEVVQAGKMIVTLARQDGRDAVFDMPAQVIRGGISKQQEVEVWLADNADIKTTGHIREVSPQADPSTRTYQVKVGLTNPPSSMFLGSTVVGKFKIQADTLIEVPSSALAMTGENPAVWVIDPKTSRVHKRKVKIAHYTQDGAVVAEGLQSGERIVIAGTQSLYDGQKVKLLEAGHEGR